MQFQIITFGNGEILKGVFDAIAMCLNSQTGTLYTPLLRIGMIFGVLWAAIYSIWGDFLKAWGRATLPFIFIPPLLFIPSSTVYIHDVVSNYRDKVDHVPYGLAYVAHFVSQIGYEVTKQVDQVFANVDDLKYHKSGFLMASNLIQQARTFRITNEDVASTMREFVCQCVTYEAMLGYKYTFEDLRHSSDIWGLVSARPSAIRSFIWRHPHQPDEPSQPPEIVSCREGVKRFNKIWRGELDKAKTIFGVKLFGHANPLTGVNQHTARTEFLKYLPASYGFLSGLGASANEILKQQMMIHAVVDGIEQKSTSLGNAPNFAARRAYLQQRSTYETLGAMASESLMTMKAVLEGIVYASFIFLVPLAVLPFGVKILLSWLQTLLWLQMWAPLYAVLNFMVSMGARSKSIGMLSVSNPEGVTIASSVGLMNLNADISAMAGYLAMSIPFIAIALVKGVGSFVHMASHLGNVSQGAAAQSAGDAVSGNYNFGNVSEGNHQIANTNMLSQSRAASYRAGAFQLIDGREDITTMADGSQIANIGVSNLPVSINVAKTQSSQLSEMAANTYQKSLNQSASSAKSLTSSYRQMVDLSENLAKSESMADGASTGINSEQSQAVHASKQMIQDFADNHNISVEKAANLFVEASVGGGAFLKGAVGGKSSINASDQEMLQEAQKYMEDHQFQEAARKSSQASKNLSHTLTDESSKRLAEGVSGSYEHGMQQRQEAAKSYSESQSLTRQAMNMSANSAAINANYNQQFFEWLSAQRSDNTTGHIGHRGAADIVAKKPEEAVAWQNKFMAERGLAPHQPLAATPRNLKESYDTEAERGLVPHKPLAATPRNLKENYDTETGHQVYTPTKEPLHAVKRQLPPEFDHPMGRECSVSGGYAQGEHRDNTVLYPDNINPHQSPGSGVLAQGAAGNSAIQHGNERDVRQTPGSSASSHPSQGDEIKPERIIVSPEPGKRQSGVESLPLPEFNRLQESAATISGGQAQGVMQSAVGDSAIQYGRDKDDSQIPGSFPSVPENPSREDGHKPEGIMVSSEPGKRQSGVKSLPLPEFNRPQESAATISGGQAQGVTQGAVGDSATQYGSARDVPQIPGSFPSVPENPSQGDYPKPEGIPASLEADKRGSEVESLPLPESTHSAGRESGASGRHTSQGPTTATPEDNVPQYPGSDAPQTSRPSAPLTPAIEDRSTGHPTDADIPPAPGSAFKENLSARGDKLREETVNVLEDGSQIIDRGSTSLTQQGAKVQKKVKGQQGKSVIGRATKKVGEEISETIFGEPQQK